jgi:zinc transport system ATP-binding protein
MIDSDSHQGLSWDDLPIVQVENLTVMRGQYPAVKSVSFQLFAGTNTAIIGPNGAGKSTLIQAILGLISYQSGCVKILGKKVANLGKSWSEIGYIPQLFPFDRSFPLTVFELVCLAYGKPSFRLGKNDQQIVTKMIEQVGLGHCQKQAIGSLSGGQLKRVLLAYNLVVPRKLLVLDEAMAGVDASGEDEFAKLLTQLQKEQGFTILQVSHDLDMVSNYCDQVICINQHLLCHGQPQYTLSPENLNIIYGANLRRYFHHHVS